MTVSFIYLDKVSDACWGSEDDPLVHRNGLLVLVFLDCDVPPEEQQWERGHLGAIVQEDLRTHREMLMMTCDEYYNKRVNKLSDRVASLWHTMPNSYSVVWALSVPLVRRVWNVFQCLQGLKCHHAPNLACVALLPIHFPPCAKLTAAYVEWFDDDTQNEKSLNQRQTKYFSQIIKKKNSE